MKTEKLETLITEITDNIYKNDLAPDIVERRMTEHFGQDISQIPLQDMLGFLANESRLYSNYLVHDLLLKLADKGYLVDPDSKQG